MLVAEPRMRGFLWHPDRLKNVFQAILKCFQNPQQRARWQQLIHSAIRSHRHLPKCDNTSGHATVAQAFLLRLPMTINIVRR
jgi:hypothetical protein